MADWRKLIGKKETLVLPYLGGPRVRAKDREVRLTERPEKVGWYRFEIEGRNATATAPADADLTGLPKVRGHLAYETLFAAAARPERIAIMPDDEPPLFASCICFRWHGGDLLFGELELEGETEEDVRRRFSDRETLQHAAGVPATLRAAFAWATVRRASLEAEIPCSPTEAWPHTSEIADSGPKAAAALLARLDELRNGRRIVVAGGHTVRLRSVTRPAGPEPTLGNAEERAMSALDAAGGRLTAVRRLMGGQQLEVHFDFAGERFVTLVQALSLRVIDAGICLVDHDDGHRGDEELTLESLPAAIREAIGLGALVITRR